MGEKPKSDTPDLKVIVTRRFKATAERVFGAWLDPASARRWLFATPGGAMQRCEIDPRVGGKFVVAEQRGEILAEHFGTFVEIDRPRKLVFDFATEPDGDLTRVTVEFKAVAGGCEMTLWHVVPPQWAAFVDRARAGWTMIADGLARTTEGNLNS